MARPPCTWTTRLYLLWQRFLAWLMLFYRFGRNKDGPTANGLASKINTEPKQASSEDTDQPIPVSQCEESSEPEDSEFVTSKTDIAFDHQDQTSINPPSTHVPEIKVEEGVDQTTTKGRIDELMYVLRKTTDVRAISIVCKLLQEACKKIDTDGIDDPDKCSDEETSPYVSVDLPGEDDGDDDIDAKKDHAQQESTVSPQETTSTATGGNVAEEPPEVQDATEVAASDETDQHIAPLRSLLAEKRNTASDCFAGTPDNGRPPESNGHKRHDNGYNGSGPRDMHPETPNTILNCFNVDTYDPSAGPSGLFQTENPGPPNAADGFLQGEETGHRPWDDCWGINGEVDSGPKEMLFGVSAALADTGRLTYGDDDDDDNGYHGDVSSGDDQLPRDAWGLEHHEDVADKGLVISAMQHVSKASGQDMGIVGEDTDDLKLSIEATGNEEDNSRASFDMEPQGNLHVNNNNNGDNNDVMGCTPNMDCG